MTPVRVGQARSSRSVVGIDFMKTKLTAREKKLKFILDLYRDLAAEAIELADQYSGKDSETVKAMMYLFDAIDVKMSKFIGED